MDVVDRKSNYAKSKYITQIIKVFALQLWCKNKNIQQIEIYSEDDSLVRSVSTFCQTKEILFNFKSQNKKSF